MWDKIKVFLFDLFFVISGFVGVGFATGKELEHFFTSSKNLVLSVVIFLIVYVVLSFVILRLREKENIESLQQLNKFAFGEYDFVFNVFLIILFIITNSAMLAGCDNIMKNSFGITFPVGSVCLSLVTLLISLGGIKIIKKISNYVIPLLLIFILANILFNKNCNFVSGDSKWLGVVFPILFCCENCVMLISVLIKTKSKAGTLSLISGMVLSIIVLLATRVASNFFGDMPLLLASNNVSKWFHFCYLFGIIFALFLTLQISSYNSIRLTLYCNKNFFTKSKNLNITTSPICKTEYKTDKNQTQKNTKFENNKSKILIAFLIICFSQIVSFLGFNFIIKYLYSLMGICGAVYMLILIIRIIVLKIK